MNDLIVARLATLSPLSVSQATDCGLTGWLLVNLLLTTQNIISSSVSRHIQQLHAVYEKSVKKCAHLSALKDKYND